MRNYKISRRNFLAVAGTLTAAAVDDDQHIRQHSFFQRGKR